MNRYLISSISMAAMMAAGPSICFAANKDEGEAFPNPAIVNDGQIAMTVKNKGDGTYDVTAGPAGEVLHSGLSREEAMAIVGAPTGPYDPKDHAEAKAADKRLEAEKKLVDDAGANVLTPDSEDPNFDPMLRNRSVTDPRAPKEEEPKTPKSKAKATDTASAAQTGAGNNGG